MVEECIANALIERFFVADLGESRLSQRYNLISVERARAIFVVLKPESVNNDGPFVVVRCVVIGCGVSFLSCSRFIVVDAAVWDLIWLCSLVTFLAFLLNRTNLLLLLLHMLLLLKVHLLLLLFDYLIHENGLIHPLGRI